MSLLRARSPHALIASSDSIVIVVASPDRSTCRGAGGRIGLESGLRRQNLRCRANELVSAAEPRIDGVFVSGYWISGRAAAIRAKVVSSPRIALLNA
jgi:hypothetical protein